MMQYFSSDTFLFFVTGNSLVANISNINLAMYNLFGEDASFFGCRFYVLIQSDAVAADKSLCLRFKRDAFYNSLSDIIGFLQPLFV